MNLPDPKAPPSKMDRLVHGEDCVRHPLVGCIVGHGNGSPAQQARSFLVSLRNATIQQIAGRDGNMSEAEFQGWWRRLEEWEAAGNQVPLPPRIMPGDHPAQR